MGYAGRVDIPVASHVWRRLGIVVNRRDCGIDLTRVEPDAAASQRRWHRREVAGVLLFEGELVLRDDGNDQLAVLLAIGSSRPDTAPACHSPIDLRRPTGQCFPQCDGIADEVS